MPRLHDAAVLFIDHQVGSFNLVQDTSLDSFKYTILAVGDTAKFFDLKIVMTTSREDGPNGPIMPKLKAKFPNAPYVARPGQINAWDDPDFFKAGENSLSGIVTDAAGYDVFVVTDASGTFNEAIRDASWSRLEASGIQLMNYLEGLAKMFGSHMPNYKALMDGYNGAVASAKN
ncbi:Isochorismatase-like protein [Umbelopsis sp. AD052]|nr:Isochorismatase-like protein [Umbelopsis sp. AD052]